MKYPDTDYQFKTKLLMIAFVNIPNIEKFRHGTFEAGSVEKQFQDTF